MNELIRTLDYAPVGIEFVVQATSIAGQHNFAAYSAQHLSKLAMLIICHLMPIRLTIPTRAVRVRRIAVEQRFRAVVALNNLNRWGVFDLHTQEPLRDQSQIFHCAKPSGDCSCHTCAAGEDTMRPSTRARSLRQTSADLSGTDVEPARTLQVSQAIDWLSACQLKFFPGKRGQANLLDEGILLSAKDSKKVDEFTIQVIVGLDRRWLPIDENRC